MIAGDDVMNSSKEDIMKTILDNVHKHKITPPKKPGGRFITYSEKVNEMYYNYSTADTMEKIAALNTLSQKILTEKVSETA